MRNQYDMDKLLRQRLQNAEVPVPESMWDQITSARQQRKGYFSGWAGFVGAVLVVALLAGYLAFDDARAQPKASETPALEAPALPSIFEDEHYDLAAESAKEAGIEDKADGELNAADQIASASTTNNGYAVTQNSSSVSANTARVKAETELTGLSSSTAGKSNLGSMRNEASTTEISDKNTGAPTAALETQRLITAGARTPEAVQGLHPRLSQIITNDQAGQALPTLSILHQSRKKGPSCYSFNSYLRGLSFDVYGAPEYAARQLVYKNPGMAEYAAQRKDMESFSFAYSMGLRASVHFQGGLAIRTGLVFTDIVEKFTFNDPDAEITKVIQVSVDTTFLPGGDVLITVDTLSVVEYGHREKTGYNSYRFYDVPLILGYEFDRGRWILSLNTGVMLNIATARRGNMLDPDKRLVSISSNETDSFAAFRSRVGSSLIMSLGVNYALTSKLHLLVEPQFRMWMQPLTLKDYPIDQKYVNLGLAFGFRQYL